MRTLTLALLGCLVTLSISFAAESVAVPSTPADPESRLEYLLREAQVLGKPKRLYGGNDVKFIVRLDDGSPEGLKAIFRPEHKQDHLKHLKEIAAYRLGKLLVPGHVPVAVKRSFSVPLLRRAPNPSLKRLVIRKNNIEGALQAWVKNGSEPFSSGALKWAGKWRRQLSVPGREIESNQEAQQYIALVVFDFLISNCDRFSGGNLLRDDRGVLWFIDNADTFCAASGPTRRLERLQRFDRDLELRLTEISEDMLRQLLNDLLPERLLEVVIQRWTETQAHVHALLEEHSEDAVFL